MKGISHITYTDQYQFEATITDEKLYEEFLLHLPDILADIKDNFSGYPTRNKTSEASLIQFYLEIEYRNIKFRERKAEE